MADRRILEKYRKPRQTRGTPFHRHRNYLALALFGFSGLSLALYELSPAAKKLRAKQYSGYFDDSPELQARNQIIQLSRNNPSLEHVFTKARHRLNEKDEEDRPKTWLEKLYSKVPELYCNKLEKISKYFLKNTSSEPKTDISDDCESPYKHLISDIKTTPNDSTSDDNDFKTPKPIRKFAPVKEKKNVSTRARTRTKQTKLTKKPGTTTIDLDVNVDHLEMAIALSKSSFEAENPEKKLEEDPSETTVLKMATMKATLEQFGFRSNKPVGPRKPSQTAKRKKPSKFKYITPTLMSRTQEERETLINEKITQIMSQNLDNANQVAVEIDFKLCTGVKNLVAEESNILSMNKQMVDDLEYLVKNLGISQTGNNCGVHLKDWGEIAGRDKSPIRSDKSKSPDILGSVKVLDSPDEDATILESKKVDRSVSPDLFASDDEFPPVSSPIKLSQSEEILDLTQSSDEEEKVSTLLNEDFKRSKDYYNLDFSDEEIKEEEHITSIKSLCTQSSFSVDFEDNSFGYNTTKSLNVTDYVTQMLKEDRSVREEVNRSSKIEGKIVIEDEIQGVDKADSHLEITRTDGNVPFKKRDKIEIISDTEDEDQDSNHSLRICSQEILSESPTEKMDINLSGNEDQNKNNYLKISNQKTIPFGSPSDKIDVNLSQTEDNTPLKNRDEIETVSDTEDEDQDNYCPIDKMDVSLGQTEDNTSLKNRDKIETISDVKNVDQDSNYCSESQIDKMDVSQADEININSSQESSISLDLDLSLNDEELNYSSHFATPFKNYDLDAEYPGPSGTPVTHFTDPGLSNKSFKSRKSLHDQFLDDSFGKMLDNTEVIKEIEKVEENVATPPKVIIKTDNVTPMPNYDSMDTPKIVNELNKYGLKPLKRTRGVQILKHIYDSMHPFAPEHETEDLPDTKRRKTDFQPIISEKLLQNENPEDLIFERKQSSKIKSCKIPLQIVWHNFLTNNPQIMESILLYEPLQLEVIHGMLKEEGFKFHIEDLLTFLDKKCITIRTAQGKQHNKR